MFVLSPGLQYDQSFTIILKDVDDMPQVPIQPMELGTDFYFRSFLHSAKIVENICKSFYLALFVIPDDIFEIFANISSHYFRRNRWYRAFLVLSGVITLAIAVTEPAILTVINKLL